MFVVPLGLEERDVIKTPGGRRNREWFLGLWFSEGVH